MIGCDTSTEYDLNLNIQNSPRPQLDHVTASIIFLSSLGISPTSECGGLTQHSKDENACALGNPLYAYSHLAAVKGMWIIAFALWLSVIVVLLGAGL